jgi:hypothetical protein
MTKREFLKLKKTAYHEAGHAVAAFAMSKRFKKVSIIPNPEDNSQGRFSGYGLESKVFREFDEGARSRDFDRGGRLRHEVEAQIIICFAGPVAAAQLTGRFSHISASKDYNDAVFCAGYVTRDQETEAYLKWLFERTKIILSHRWDAVELLADELINRREIGYKAARKIIIKGIDGPLPPLDLKRAMAKKSRS